MKSHTDINEAAAILRDKHRLVNDSIAKLTGMAVSQLLDGDPSGLNSLALCAESMIATVREYQDLIRRVNTALVAPVVPFRAKPEEVCNG